MRPSPRPHLLAALAAVCVVVCACNPSFNWREYHSAEAGYRVLFPGKPSSMTRGIELAGTKLNMTLTAAEVDEVNFAVGSAEVPDASQAQAVLGAMKTALVNNIGATVKRESASSSASAVGGAARRSSTIEIEALGSRQGVPVMLVGRFIARDKRVYQVVVMGKEQRIARENIDTFLSSFKLE
jgi:hypothetical protein